MLVVQKRLGPYVCGSHTHPAWILIQVHSPVCSSTIQVAPSMVVRQGATLVLPAARIKKWQAETKAESLREQGKREQLEQAKLEGSRPARDINILNFIKLSVGPCWGTSSFWCSTSGDSNTAANVSNHGVWSILPDDIRRVDPLLAKGSRKILQA